MKEIKFRCFEKDLGMHYISPESDFTLTFGDNVPMVAVHCSDGVMDGFTADNVMQFTGLLDKNGKEIYEGDIYTTDGKNSYQVIFNNGSFCGGKNLKATLPLAWNVDEDGEDLMTGDTSWLEVIGNIYEDKHLLDNN